MIDFSLKMVPNLSVHPQTSSTALPSPLSTSFLTWLSLDLRSTFAVFDALFKHVWIPLDPCAAEAFSRCSTAPSCPEPIRPVCLVHVTCHDAKSSVVAGQPCSLAKITHASYRLLIAEPEWVWSKALDLESEQLWWHWQPTRRPRARHLPGLMPASSWPSSSHSLPGGNRLTERCSNCWLK